MNEAAKYNSAYIFVYVNGVAYSNEQKGLLWSPKDRTLCAFRSWMANNNGVQH